PFFDNTALIKNFTDPTKRVIFDASLLTTGQTRTLKAQDANYTIAGREIDNLFSFTQTFNSLINAGTPNLHTGTINIYSNADSGVRTLQAAGPNSISSTADLIPFGPGLNLGLI